MDSHPLSPACVAPGLTCPKGAQSPRDGLPALQVELCSPRLFRLAREARRRSLGLSRGSGVQGQPTQPTPFRRAPQAPVGARSRGADSRATELDLEPPRAIAPVGDGAVQAERAFWIRS